MTRRQFLHPFGSTAALGIAGLSATSMLPGLGGTQTVAAEANAIPTRRFSIDLTPGAIGVSGDMPEMIRLARAHGFESVQPDTGYLGRQDAEGLKRLRASLDEAGLKWGAAGLPVEFRQGDEPFRRDLDGLPKVAAALRTVGADRIGTWLMPGHNELERAQNFDRHVARLREVARTLRQHGVRLGLEYVGTPSIAARFKFPFVRRLSEAKELIAAIDVPGTGVVLDSWHWFCAGDTVEALTKLRHSDVIAVDLNDAPRGVALPEQQDNRRELPAATGVIPVQDFLGALLRIEYDGPVRAEPFNQPLNQLDNEAACAQTVAAIRKALALVKS